MLNIFNDIRSFFFSFLINNLFYSSPFTLFYFSQCNDLSLYSPISNAAVSGVLSIKQPLAMIRAKRLRFQLPFQFRIRSRLEDVAEDDVDDEWGQVVVEWEEAERHWRESIL